MEEGCRESTRLGVRRKKSEQRAGSHTTLENEIYLTETRENDDYTCETDERVGVFSYCLGLHTASDRGDDGHTKHQSTERRRVCP